MRYIPTTEAEWLKEREESRRLQTEWLRTHQVTVIPPATTVEMSWRRSTLRGVLEQPSEQDLIRYYADRSPLDTGRPQDIARGEVHMRQTNLGGWPVSRRRKLSGAKVHDLVRLKGEGLSQAAIARKTGLSQGTVCKGLRAAKARAANMAMVEA